MQIYFTDTLQICLANLLLGKFIPKVSYCSATKIYQNLEEIFKNYWFHLVGKL